VHSSAPGINVKLVVFHLQPGY